MILLFCRRVQLPTFCTTCFNCRFCCSSVDINPEVEASISPDEAIPLTSVIPSSQSKTKEYYLLKCFIYFCPLMDKCWVQTSAGCPRHTQKCLLRLGTAEGRCGTSRSLEAGFVFADEWFVRHTSATYIINVFVCFPRFTSHPDLFPQVHKTNPHAPLHVQMSQELLLGQKMKLWNFPAALATAFISLQVISHLKAQKDLD